MMLFAPQNVTSVGLEGASEKISRLTIAHHILGPLINYAIIRWLLVQLLVAGVIVCSCHMLETRLVLWEYSKFLNTYRRQFLKYLTEWRRFFTLATTPSNQQNQQTVRCHKNSWNYLTSTYYWWLLRPTITIRFNLKWLFAQHKTRRYWLWLYAMAGWQAVIHW